MEMNKGEAEKCRDIAKKFLREGKYAQAIKFFDKSHRMFPLPGVEAMCERAKAELTKASTQHRPTSDTSNIRHRPAATSSASNTTAEDSTRPYTADQVQIVNKIRACKTHYQVLSVEKNADDNAIKKAYRKLALKLHPDKNSAPGAEDAFKAVGKAFTILSDPDKRADYDRYGENTPSSAPQTRRRYQQEDVSPEELFNMFFGGGMRPRRRTQPQPQQAPQEQRSPLMQFLPLLLLFLMSMLSIPSTPEPPFSMHPTAQYNVLRETQMSSVAKGIPYYVEQDFDRRYTSHWRDLLQVEQMVERHHLSRLAEHCEQFKLKQKRMIVRARKSTSDDRETQIRNALEMKMPACEQLKKLRRSRNKR